MKHLFTLIACLALAGTAIAEPAYGVKVDAQAFRIELPQDQDRPYVTLFGSPTDPRYNAVRQWFDNNPNLAKLKTEAHFAEIPTDSLLFTDRYASTCPKTPCVRVQDADGTVRAEFAPLPISAEALNRGLSRCFNAPADSSPSATPPPPPASDHRPYILLAILIAAGAIVGAVRSFRTRTPKGTT